MSGVDDCIKELERIPQEVITKLIPENLIRNLSQQLVQELGKKISL